MQHDSLSTSAAAGRRRFALTSAVVALSLLGDASLYALLPAQPGHFHVAVWQVGVLLGVNRLVRLLTNELAGRVVGAFGGRRPLLAAVVVGSAITAGYALPLGFWWLLGLRVLWGACWSLLRVEGYLTALSVSSGSSRGRVFGTYQAITRMGQGGGVLVGGLASDLIGIPRVYLLFGACTLVGVLLVRALPRGAPPLRRNVGAVPGAASCGSAAKSGASAAKSGASAAKSGASALAASRRTLALWAAALSLTMTEQMAANLVGRLAAERIGPALTLSGAGVPFGVASLTGLLLGFRSFGSLLLAPAAGWVGDRLGRKPLLLGLAVVQMLSFAALSLLGSWQLLIGVLLVQLACGNAAHLLVYTLAGDRAPAGGEALHLSRFSTFVDLGTALGPMAAFALYGRFGFIAVALLAWVLLSAGFIAVRGMRI